MAGAPPPFQMQPMQFMQGGPSLLDQLQGIQSNLPGAKKGFGAISNALSGGGPLPGEPGAAAEGPVAPGGVSALPGTAGSASFGPAAPATQPGALDAIRRLLTGLSQGQGQTAPLVLGPDSNGGGGTIPLDASLVGRAGLSQGQGAQAPLLQALKGLDPTQILNMLKNMGQQPEPSTQGLPGSAAVNGAGLMPSTFGG